MDAVTFHAIVGEDQIIRPPAEVVLPRGDLEVSVKVVARRSGTPTLSREAANARLRQHRVSFGQATGIDNDGIDADLARVYSDSPEAP